MMSFSLDSTLTTSILMEVLKDVEDWGWGEYSFGLCDYLDIPVSKQQEIRHRYPTEDQRRAAAIEHWLSTHPVPSWKLVARALQERGEHKLADVVATKYVTGMW